MATQLFIPRHSGGPAFVDRQNPINWDHPANKGLVGWWFSLAGGGNRAIDIARGMDGTFVNDVSIVTGRHGFHAFNLGGADIDRITFDQSRLPIGSENRTISVWCKTSNTGTGDLGNCMIGWGTSGGGAGHQFYFSIENNEITVRVNSGLRKWTASGAANGKRHHFAVVLDGTNTSDLVAYMDGVLLSVSSTTARTIDTDDANGTIGSKPDPTTDANFNGDIESVSVYDRASSLSVISVLYQDGLRRYRDTLNRRPITYFIPAVGGAARRIFVVS